LKIFLTVLGILFIAVFMGCKTTSADLNVTNFYEIKVKDIEGNNISLSKYKGKVLLIINTASKCGFTKQYKGLEELYNKYKDKGLVVMGFPSNDFLKQEPGSNAEIQSFCTLNYGVSFPMFEKISVKGSAQHPLYGYLTSKAANPETAGRISWNFNKFVISRDGKIVARFGSRTKPSEKKLVQAIENEL